MFNHGHGIDIVVGSNTLLSRAHLMKRSGDLVSAALMNTEKNRELVAPPSKTNVFLSG